MVAKYIVAIGLIIGLAIAFVVGIYVSPFILPKKGPEDEVWARVVKNGKIVIGSSPDWPPYEYLEGGKFTGFEVELAEMVAERLGLKVEWKAMGFDLIIPEIEAKTIDLGVSGFSVTPERLEKVQFTMPHSITEGQIIMLKSKATELGITRLTSLEQLKEYNLICGVQVGTTQQDELKDLINAGRLPASAMRTYEDYLAALDDMKRGAIQCIYAESPVTSWWMLEAEQKGEEAMIVVYRRPYWPVAWVAHADADILVAKINGALAELISEGKVEELKIKWHCT
ncbi:MAG: transporter substrate-binding domain-containing protein [Nitrososphaerota archaeon]